MFKTVEMAQYQKTINQNIEPERNLFPILILKSKNSFVVASRGKSNAINSWKHCFVDLNIVNLARFDANIMITRSFLPAQCLPSVYFPQWNHNSQKQLLWMIVRLKISKSILD